MGVLGNIYCIPTTPGRVPWSEILSTLEERALVRAPYRSGSPFKSTNRSDLVWPENWIVPETLHHSAGALPLASWQWLPVQDKQPFRVTPFGDIFLRDRSRIYFLDTIQGSLELVCESEEELDRILASPDGSERFLMSELVSQLEASGITLEPDQCFNFMVDLVVGGAFDIENVQALDFVAAASSAGQIHLQVKDLPVGTPITSVELAEDQ